MKHLRKPENITAAVRDDVRELRLLFELSQVIDASASISHVLDTALSTMARHMEIVRGMITLISPHSGEIRIETAYGLKPAERERGHYAPGEGVIGRVTQSGKPMIVGDVATSRLFLNRTRARDLAEKTISFICVPIRLEDQILGALAVDRPYVPMPVLEDDARLLTIIASMLARVARGQQEHMDVRAAMIEENMRLRDSLADSARPPGFVGSSAAMELVYEQIAQVAPSQTTVFLDGESGTGKDLAARAIHSASGRGGKPFIALNCAALPESLIESELFGHEKGAFTGAVSMRKGRFELADGGTLFLDEVGELPPATQAKLLRVLQDRCFERLGGMETRQVDVRVITATNRNLQAMVEEGLFRRDLFYRLNVFPVHMPPLRVRGNDILPLAAHFIAKHAAADRREPARLSLVAMDMLQRYSWPGNIRELENIMERAVLLAGPGGLILPRHLPRELHSDSCPLNGAENRRQGSDQVHGSLQDRIDELECSCISDALRHCSGHMGHAAASLGLTDRVLALRMKKYGISYKEFRKQE